MGRVGSQIGSLKQAYVCQGAHFAWPSNIMVIDGPQRSISPSSPGNAFVSRNQERETKQQKSHQTGTFPTLLQMHLYILVLCLNYTVGIKSQVV